MNQIHVPYREAYSDASTLQKNISHLSDHIKYSSEMGRSADSVASVTPTYGSASSINSDELLKKKQDRLMTFRKSHISHSTGDLNLNKNLSLFGGVQLNDSQFFEVMYVGKIRVSHKKLPKTFIDDAIPKFIAHDKMKMKTLSTSDDQSCSLSESQIDSKPISTKDNNDDQSGSETSSNNSGDVKNDESQNAILKEKRKTFQKSHSINVDETIKRNRSASIGSIEQNRTMVYILGRNELRLISPDRKQILLHKNFNDVVNVIQGYSHETSDHFGIVCVEKQEYIGYVFKCQSGSISHDVVVSMLKSLETLREERLKEQIKEEENNKSPVLLTCEHCPMIWYNKLCLAIEGLSEKKIYNLILRHIEDLETEDYELLMEKYYASDKVNGFSIQEKNKFLIALVEAHCQMRQQRHVHDTIENRSEFLNHYLGGSTILMKAKRSLTSSFDQLLKRRGSKDIIEGMSSQDEPRKHKIVRSVSLSPNSPQVMSLKSETLVPERKQMNTSKMDMFLKVGNSSKENEKKENVSWRQNILKNVSQDEKPAASKVHHDDLIKLLPVKSKKSQWLHEKRSKEELRHLWKFAGKQIILLLRMEKENARLQEQQNENEIRRMKLNYDEILTCEQKLVEVWEKLINQASKTETDNRLFLQAIKSGVPPTIRGDVWLMLAKQYKKTHSSNQVLAEYPNFDLPYYELLKNLTEHQHAIFIDIGRTFPSHEFFMVPFGLGQLSLFNILKAYSILDNEVGYCQGLAFICGVLLLHLNEEDAFNLLKHLMFDRQLRLNYLPDMRHFQMQLYQTSRLIKDNLPDVYELLDKNDVATTLYASSWMLTLFSSSFELGFVTRIFDLLLFASNEVIFRVILALLEIHKEKLLQLDCFEDIMDYLKNVIPKVDANQMSVVLKHVYELNISRQLLDYKIEYNVLQDEIRNTSQHVEALKLAHDDVNNLQKQLHVAESNIECLEGIRQKQHQEIQSMQSQMQSLEVTIQTLGDYLTSLTINRIDVDIPTDIRRVLQQLEYQQNKQIQQQIKRRPIFFDRKIGKSVSVNSNLGTMNLKVLIEQNENDNQTPPCAVTPQPTDSILNSIVQCSNKKCFDEMKENEEDHCKINTQFHDRESPEKPKLVEQATIDENDGDIIETETNSQSHPLVCDDVSFHFNTKELKSIKTTNNCKK